MAKRKDVGLSVEVNGDITGLKKAMNDAVAVLKKTQSSIKDVNKAIEADPNNLDLYTKRIQLYKKAIEENAQALKELYKMQHDIFKDDNYKQGVTNLTTEFVNLERKIAETKKQQELFTKALEEAELARSNFTFEQKLRKINEELVNSKHNLDLVNADLERMNERIKLDPNNVVLYTQKQQLLAKQLDEVNKHLDNLKKKKDLLSNPLFHKVTEEETQALHETELEIAQLTHEQELLAKQLREMLTPEMQVFMNKLADVGTGLIDVANKTNRLSIAFQTLAKEGFSAAVSYESDIANIKRIVSDLSDNTIARLKDIAIETGTAFGDVSEYATFAGALGLAENQVADFTKTMIDLNTATGGAFGGEEGAKSIVVFLNALGLGIEQAEAFGSAIAVVGDKYADIGDETLRIATALSGLSTVANVSQYDLIGLAGVMANLGLSGEAASSGITRAFVQIEKAMAGGEEDIKDFAEASGLSAKQFISAWESKPLETFMRFVDGLKSQIFNDINNAIDQSSDKVSKYAELLGMSSEQFKTEWGKNSTQVFNQIADAMGSMDDAGVEAIATLTGVKLTSIRTIQTLLRLAGQGGEVANAVQLANEAWQENTALQEKASGIYDTTERKIEGAREALKQLGASIADEVMPVAQDFLEQATELMKDFSKLDPSIKKLVVAFVGFGASISPVTRTLGTFVNTLWRTNEAGEIVQTAFGSLVFGAGGVAVAVAGLVAAFAGLAYYAYETNPVRVISKEVEELTTALAESNKEADLAYQEIAKQIDGARQYADAIDSLTEKLKDNTLSAKEREEIQEQIVGYIDKLNDALGSEIFYFDTTTGKIQAQGQEVDNVRQKFEELAFTAKKQAWLDAHKDTLTEAYKNIDSANTMMDQATDQFVKSVNDIPKTYTDAFVEAGGNLDEFAQNLRDKGIEWADSGIVNALISAWDEYQKSIDESNKLLDDATAKIENYEKVQTSTAENFGTIISEIAEQSVTITDSSLSLADNVALLDEKIRALKGALDEEHASNSQLLEVYKEQYEKLKGQLDYETQKHNKLLETLTAEQTQNETVGDQLELQKQIKEIADGMLDVNKLHILDQKEILKIEGNKKSKLDDIYKTEQNISAEEKEFINYWNAWEPPTKTLTVVIETVGSIPGGIGGGGVHMGGSGTRSGGFGSLLDSTMAAINGTMANYRSGGYRSGGLTVNANFNVNSNNIGRAEVRSWANWIVDDLNEALGKKI